MATPRPRAAIAALLTLLAATLLAAPIPARGAVAVAVMGASTTAVVDAASLSMTSTAVRQGEVALVVLASRKRTPQPASSVAGGGFTWTRLRDVPQQQGTIRGEAWIGRGT